MRNELIALSETLWAEADEALARRSRHIAAAKREVANRMREVLRVPPLEHVDGNGSTSDDADE